MDDFRRGVKLMPGASFQALLAQNPGVDRFTKVLLHFDSSFVDDGAGATAHTWTAGGSAAVSTSQSKFGGASGSFPGSSWIETPDSADFTVGSGDFTIDSWFNVQGGAGTDRYLTGQMSAAGTNSSASFDIHLTTSNTLTFETYVGSTLTAVTSTTTFTAAGWHHVAAVRTGNTLKLFIDGVQEGGNVAQTGTLNDSANKLSIGRVGEFTTQTFNGFIDEFRLSVGIARWTANFTPPGVPWS
jgi:hypothetical protein